MGKLFLCLALILGSCAKEQPNPTSCAVSETSEGLFFRCIDKDGRETSGLVKNGEKGAAGEPGQKGEAGKGLVVVYQLQCKGFVEAWMENSGYQIDFMMSEFETGAVFLSSKNEMMRGGEVINERSGAAFFLGKSQAVLSDGVFDMEVAGNKLNLKSKDGKIAQLPCAEVK